MKIIYIKETEETCDIIKRIILKIKRFFNSIKIEEIKNNTIYYLPVFKDSKASKYRIKKLANKINELLEKDGANTIVLSEYLNNNEIIKNYLYSQNINILDGRYLFKCLIHDCIKHILNIKRKKLESR